MRLLCGEVTATTSNLPVWVYMRAVPVLVLVAGVNHFFIIKVQMLSDLGVIE
jgi:hypothetical protein